ncbi:sugar phosphate isomerase/epimerase family protein [Nocardioides humi]|uniref:Sugar phosphate isomerase/epimerase n=1 Tax=Nocardioides humi TaxID=449461 RepID=A0ABN2BZY9_9ACTN|nr:sugar phosphate isomerase/epimerase family protein [Nocardioides humi]
MAEYPEFILAHGCLGPVSFEERIRAAAEAGFTAIGYSVLEFNALAAEGVTLDDLTGTLKAHGVRVSELEIALGFDAGFNEPGAGAPPRWGPPSFPFDVPCFDGATQVALLEMVERLGPDHVNVLGTYGPGGSRAGERMAALCDRVSAHGATVAVEFMAGTSVPDVPTAVGLLADVDRANAGVCLDTWHYERGAHAPGALDALASDRVTVVQISDGPRRPANPDDYFAETMHLRRFPGDGEWDLVGMLRGLVARGVRAPWSIEVLSDEVQAMDPGAAARALRASLDQLAREVFADLPNAGPVGI